MSSEAVSSNSDTGCVNLIGAWDRVWWSRLFVLTAKLAGYEKSLPRMQWAKMVPRGGATEQKDFNGLEVSGTVLITIIFRAFSNFRPTDLNRVSRRFELTAFNRRRTSDSLSSYLR